jgi:hypothetical protein
MMTMISETMRTVQMTSDTVYPLDKQVFFLNAPLRLR